MLAVGEGKNGGEFENAREDIVIQDGDEKEIAGDDGTEPGQDAQGIILVGRECEGATLESGLTDEAVAEFVGSDLIRGILGKGADTVETNGMGIVGKVERAVEQGDALGDARQKAAGED